MSTYVKSLYNGLADEQARYATKKAAVTKAARDRLSPLEDRLARLLETVPLELQQEGLSLSALQTGLRGRWRGSCHPGELGLGITETWLPAPKAMAY